MSEGSLEHKLKKSIVPKLKKKGVVRTGIKLGLASLCAFAAVSVGSFFYDCPIFPRKESTKKLCVELEQGSNGMIYIGKEGDMHGDTDLRNALQPKLQMQFQDYARLTVTTLSGRNFIKPLSSEISLDKYSSILSCVNAELIQLGLAGDYRLKQLTSLDRLILDYDPSIVWLVSEMGTDISGTIGLTTRENKKEIAQINGIENNNGRVFVNTTCTPGKEPINFEMKTPLVCVRAGGLDTVDVHMSLYSELLHAALLSEYDQLLKHFFKYALCENGTLMSNDTDKAKAETSIKIINESIVHGLSHLWLKDNLGRLGLTEKDYLQEVKQKEEVFTYKGVKVIRELAAKMGRKELLDDYRSNPLKYWAIIKNQVPEYKQFE